MDTVWSSINAPIWVDYPKPTRLLSDADGLLQKGHPGWPSFNKDDYYLGPLPRHCGHQHPPLSGASAQGGFKTGPTAAYPLGMNQMLASLVFDHWFCRALAPLEGEEKPPAGPGEGISSVVTGESISHREC